MLMDQTFTQQNINEQKEKQKETRRRSFMFFFKQIIELLYKKRILMVNWKKRNSIRYLNTQYLFN